MPNQLKPLTNVEIAGAKPRSTDYELRDGEGLYLLVKTSGRKAWHFEYYHPVTKKRTKTSLGPYPVVTLAMARETRTKYRRLLYQGIDPRQHLAGIAEEKRIQNECTLEKVAEQWLKEKKRTSDLSEDHAKDVWRSLEMHVFPSLGNTPVTEIRPKMLKEHLTPLEEQGILETLRRVISRLNEIFRFAISEELIEFNPADNLVARFKKPKKQNMPALHPSELGRLMLALQNASIRKETRCLIEWELLTWVRPGEAVSARWCDIDMKNHWSICTSRPRTPRLSAWGSAANWSPTACAAARTAGAGHFPREVLESVLAHQKEDEIEAAYNRSDYLEQRRPLMQWWGNYVDAARRQALLGAEEPLQIVEGE